MTAMPDLNQGHGGALAPSRDDAADPYAAFRRRLLTPERVRQLSQRRPQRVIRDTAVCWAIIVAAWLAAAAIGTWWSALLGAVVVGNRYYALFIIGHDGMHRRLFGDVARNDLFNDLFALGPICAITRINNRNHLRHHANLSTTADPDRHKHTCLNKATPLQLVGYLTSVTTLWRSATNVFARRGEAPSATTASATATTAVPAPRYRLRDVAIVVGWQLGLIVVLTKLFGWWGYPAMWLVPVFVFMFLADNLRTFAEHSQPTNDEDADRHRLVTNEPGWLERQLLAPMNMHYHATHHLWPSIPYYNLPTASAEVRAASGADGLTWRGSYLRYLASYARKLPIEGCRGTARERTA